MDMFVKLSAFDEHCTNCINIGKHHFLSVLFEWLTQHRWFPRITNRFSCRSNSFLFLMSLVCWFFAETRIAFEIESNGHHWCCIDRIFFFCIFALFFIFYPPREPPNPWIYFALFCLFAITKEGFGGNPEVQSLKKNFWPLQSFFSCRRKEPWHPITSITITPIKVASDKYVKCICRAKRWALGESLKVSVKSKL